MRSAFPGACLTALVVLASGTASGQVPKRGEHAWDKATVVSWKLRPQPYAVPLESAGMQLEASVATGWRAFQAERQGRWWATVDLRNGRVDLVEGSGIPFVPGAGNSLGLSSIASHLGGKAEPDIWALESIARAFLPGVSTMLGLDGARLGLDPGRSGKQSDYLWFVDFDVYTPGGLPIEGARVVLRVNNGNLIQIGTENLPSPGTRVPGFPMARDEAYSIVEEIAGGFDAATDRFVDRGSQHILPVAAEGSDGPQAVAMGKGYELASVWQFVWTRDGVIGTWRARVDAETGELLEFADVNLYATAQVTGGVYPSTYYGSTESVSPMPFASITSNATSNSAGLFDFTGTAGTTALSGPYVQILDSCGTVGESTDVNGNITLGTLAWTTTPSPNDCGRPTGTHSAGDTQASRMQFYQVNRAMEKGRAWLPANTWLKQRLTVNVNLPNSCATNGFCNAFWSPSGGTLNFYIYYAGVCAGYTTLRCGNTGLIGGVSLHEYGHGLDSNDGSGSSPDYGTGETYGDFTATLQTHDSCTGPGFWATGTNCGGYGDACTACSGVRDIDFARHTSGTAHTVDNFTRTRCPTSTSYKGPCGREGHCESQVSSEAMWDLAARDLRAAPLSLPAGEAWSVVDRLWYLSRPTAGAAFACTASGTPWTSNGCSAGHYWKVLRAVDDDNGNLADGTPHSCALYAAFNRHGIACATDPGAAVCYSGCTPPATPVLTATAGTNRVTLSWTASSGVYDLYRNETSCDSGFTKIADGLTTTVYADPDVANGSTYNYQVVAHPAGNEACASAPSTCKSASPVAQPSAVYVRGSAAVTGAPAGGDGDAYLDNCETATVAFSVRNDGNVALSNVSVMVTSTSPFATLTSSMPITVAALAVNASADLTFAFQAGAGATKAACGETPEFSISVTSDQQTGSNGDTFGLGPVELDEQLGSPIHGFETGTDGWTLTGYSRDSSRASAGTWSLHSSSGADGACDKAVSPQITVTASSQVVMSVWYDIELQSSGQWWDRANVHAVNVATGVHTLLTPTGATYNASGGAGAGLCHVDGENGWGGAGKAWAEATFNLAALSGQTIRLEVNYNTDSASANTGHWLDNVRFTNVVSQVCDAAADICASCASPTFGGVPVAVDLSACGDTGVQVSWTDAVAWGDDGVNVAGRSYAIERSVDGTAWVPCGADPDTMSPFVDLNGTNGIPYQYRVVATNGCGTPATTAASSSAADQLVSATVSGTAAICAGESATIEAALTGTGPWSLTWSDGTAQPGVVVTPATRLVDPAATTTYSVTSVTTASCTGTSSGSAEVTVNPVPAQPTITSGTSVVAGSFGNSANVDPHAGATFQWTVGNGTLGIGQGTAEITYAAGTSGAVSLSVVETVSGCDSEAGTATVPIVPALASSYHVLAPCRVIDTRNAEGPGGLGGPALVAGVSRTFQLAGACGIPETATAVSINVTVTQGGAAGSLTIYPGGGAVPLATAINFGAGRTRANNVMAKVQSDGLASLSVLNGSEAAVHFILDVNGYFE